jgi:hypothetical protein
VDQRLAELVAVLRIDNEPAEPFLLDLEAIIRSPIGAGLLAHKAIGVSVGIGRGFLLRWHDRYIVNDLAVAR